MTDPYHGIHRGCKVISKKQPTSSKNLIDGRYCTTHHVDLCSCSSTWDHGIPEELRKKKVAPSGIRKNETLSSQEEAL
jgi:hypothetical protein